MLLNFLKRIFRRNKIYISIRKPYKWTSFKRIVIIKLNGKKIGFMRELETWDDDYFICGFVINEEFRGKGYGSQALQRVIDFCRKEHRASKIRLSCSPVRRPFYERNGFVHESDNHMYYNL